jgi:acetyl esterase
VPVDPFVQEMLNAMPAGPPMSGGASVADLRARAHADMTSMFTTLAEDGPSPARVADRHVGVDHDSIAVRVYTPEGEGPFPAYLYIHGGGFWLGNLDMFESGCRFLCHDVPCVVVSVDYRLAPEHRYPTAPEDCYAALLWLVDHAAELDVDPARIAVGGGSAGGNLAAVVALMARDRGGPALAIQVLEIPVTDLTMSQPSVEENGEGYMLTREGMAQYVNYYLASPDQATESYASPLLAEDLSRLAPAVVMCAEYDPLRDEGLAYARRLEEAGVAVEVKCWEGQIHGSMAFTKVLASARAQRAQVTAAVRRAFSEGKPG